ncbi:MAG: hypothetical protein ACSLEL_03590 [Candidatus Malihini olakiniferum]
MIKRLVNKLLRAGVHVVAICLGRYIDTIKFYNFQGSLCDAYHPLTESIQDKLEATLFSVVGNFYHQSTNAVFGN